ncbi:MAG: CRISPR-associated endonuclease Cas2 [Desulfofustis sp. PB-SRB1]|jgi:CRISPR-associated protein Cas2|nr:CRISPR-associated endonuclease Cas2 [Desulfofustis sp. PB-SRB1]MBM1003140.1 CRISPR-associated endonuclease Cas2 [Desulfofustis sp. PB-SRB1]
MRFLAIYDIADPKRLNRVAKIMKDYGFRVQQSKFEIDVSEHGFAELRRRVGSVIIEEEDGVKYIPLCRRCRQRTEVIGKGRYIDPEKEFVVI